jgi:steroid delta-isomerase-like uncharacterized protein
MPEAANNVLTQIAEDLLAKLHAAVNAHDAEAIGALCTDDVEWEDPAASEPLRGRAAVIRFHREGMFRALPDVALRLVDGPYIMADGQGLAVRTRIQGTMTGPLIPPGFAPTGRRIQFETAEFSRLRDGRLCRHTVMIDMLDLARQIGAAPASGGLIEHLGVGFQRVAAAVARHRVKP